MIAIGSTLGRSIVATRPCSMIVTYGISDAPPAPVGPSVLMQASKGAAGAELWDYLNSATERARRSRALFAALSGGMLLAPPIGTFALTDGWNTHRRLEDHGFSRKVVLIP
ncbi:quinone oxidoreductase (NADPH:quinone reductase) [Komagataeibacter medellinensis NBRC 3288]|uniref:Quinone oxidoreductase (NADPH:quinone reductase) n=1 Tax=Komagataeibacter medellinensis (strain NBRC 3288 / BCRC 11682 / LMG 1693 / Kondo 51) TaxID=634177 RepID=G2I4U0_KOMMN|nr:quinone oxidoreductase (NADPH:quinone reductase) [Komagataeibacter medellinensis NBRC 3288]